MVMVRIRFGVRLGLGFVSCWVQIRMSLKKLCAACMPMK